MRKRIRKWIIDRAPIWAKASLQAENARLEAEIAELRAELARKDIFRGCNTLSGLSGKSQSTRQVRKHELL